VEPQSETVWRQANRYRVPRIVFINKMDRTGANFWRTVETIRERLGARPLPIQLPIGVESSFRGIVDLVESKAITYSDEQGTKVEEAEIPEEMRQIAEEHRAHMIEAIADVDDEIMHKYLEGKPISTDEIKAGLRKITLQVSAVPILCGSALKNKGIQPLLDAVVDYLPAPLDVPPVEGINVITGLTETRRPDDSEPPSALVFKIVADPFVGKLSYLRIYSGVIRTGMQVLNSTSGNRERIGRLLLMHANHREEVEELHAGEIGGAVGLKNTFTGDTLCTPDRPIVLETIKFPAPVISVAIEPKTRADQDKMGIALSRLAEEDPTFLVRVDSETGQTIISGMGELHLEVLVDRMLREYKVQANVGRPQVAYREAITISVEAEGRFVRQTGGRGQYGHVWLKIEPLPAGSGFEFVNKIVGATVPKEYIPAVREGVREAMDGGVVAGYPLVDVKATLFDGSYHPVDSSEIAFKVAGSMAFKSGVARAKPVILEPMMKVEVVIPEEFLGEVMGDLNSLRGHITGVEMQGDQQIIRVEVPLAEMFGYATDLRSKTQGRGSHSMEFSHYQEVPRERVELVATRARRRG